MLAPATDLVTPDGTAERRLILAELQAVTAGFVSNPHSWMPHLRDNEANRWFVRLLDTAEYDVWCIGWPSGAGVALHDHGGAIGTCTVVHGQLLETVTDRATPARRRWRTLTTGTSVTFGPNHVHGMNNVDDAVALSIHAYAPRLATMTFFHGDGDELNVSRIADADDSHAAS